MKKSDWQTFWNEGEGFWKSGSALARDHDVVPVLPPAHIPRPPPSVPPDLVLEGGDARGPSSAASWQHGTAAVPVLTSRA